MDNFPFIPVLIGLFVSILACTVWLTWNFTKAAMLNKMGESPEEPPQSRAKERVSAPGPGPPEADSTLLSIRRGPTLMWEIRVQGQRYRTLQAVPEDEVKEEVVIALRELAAFARDYIQKSPAAKAPPPAAPPRSEPTVAPSTLPPALLGSPSRGRGERETGRSSGSMLSINLAQEIGDIVAELQEQVPALQKHAIDLQNVPGGGIRFLVNGEIYGDVSEIPDPKIQALIRHATKEWERR